ncbi:MAG: NAD-dependent epimerase/dehydratase family protein [candidate division Zixibacteria bacterium]|nr:NAD-dependent epimerase/dehydratase family protein [candidate division Zixibacteria bacterium]
MPICIVTGSAGLIGSESARYFAEKGFTVVGVDNDMRRYFFGDEASTAWNREKLERELPDYRHFEADIRDEQGMDRLFAEYGRDIAVIVHTAAQPSHDWAAREPFVDFSVNANGTLVLLEMTRKHCPEAVFLFMSTNKVYGDTPNRLPLVETETRWTVDTSHPYHVQGIDETMSIDATTHSLFGASKVAADVLVQEYGRYFGMKTVAFRGGCLTGPAHSGTRLHGFLAYLMKCAIQKTPYTVFGYKGKQVRDNLHSHDLVDAFWEVYRNPVSGEVYNMGGGRYANCSILEAIALCEEITDNRLSWTYSDVNRIGDHIWYVSDLRKFESHYPTWKVHFDLRETLVDIYTGMARR